MIIHLVSKSDVKIAEATLPDDLVVAECGVEVQLQETTSFVSAFSCPECDVALHSPNHGRI